MKFSRKSTYGIRAMINIAKNQKDGNVSLAAISQTEKISRKYLEQLVSKLMAAGLLESKKGKSGGYKLGRPIQKIKLIEIVEALEGKVSPANCLKGDGSSFCAMGSSCGVLPIMEEIQTATKKILKKTSLADVTKNHNK